MEESFLDPWNTSSQERGLRQVDGELVLLNSPARLAISDVGESALAVSVG